MLKTWAGVAGGGVAPTSVELGALVKDGSAGEPLLAGPSGGENTYIVSPLRSKPRCCVDSGSRISLSQVSHSHSLTHQSEELRGLRKTSEKEVSHHLMTSLVVVRSMCERWWHWCRAWLCFVPGVQR